MNRNIRGPNGEVFSPGDLELLEDGWEVSGDSDIGFAWADCPRDYRWDEWKKRCIAPAYDELAIHPGTLTRIARHPRQPGPTRRTPGYGAPRLQSTPRAQAPSTRSPARISGDWMHDYWPDDNDRGGW